MSQKVLRFWWGVIDFRTFQPLEGGDQLLVSLDRPACFQIYSNGDDASFVGNSIIWLIENEKAELKAPVADHLVSARQQFLCFNNTFLSILCIGIGANSRGPAGGNRRASDDGLESVTDTTALQCIFQVFLSSHCGGQ